MAQNLDSQLYLAIDQGGQSTRMGVYNIHGNIVAYTQAQIDTQKTNDSKVEIDGSHLVASIQNCLKDIKHTLGKDVQNLHSAGFSGQGASFLFWHRQTKQPLSPVISWQDTRAKDFNKIKPILPDRFKEKTGIVLSPHYGASKIHWCLQHLDPLKKYPIDNNIRVGPVANFVFDVVSSSTDRFYIDPGHAQRTALWNINTCDWDNELTHAFSIPASLLPECVFHQHKFGNLVIDSKITDINVSIRDQAASLFAYGEPESNAYYINIGTGAFVQRKTTKNRVCKGVLLSPLWFDKTEKTYSWESPINGAASAISWMEKSIGEKLQTDDIKRYLNTTITKKIIFINSIFGLSAPYWRTNIIPEFMLEKEQAHSAITTQEKVTAWIESILFQIYENTKLMDASLGENKFVYISGGLSNLDSLCQKLANITQKVIRRRECTETSLQGCAYLTAGRPTHWNPPISEQSFSPKEDPAIVERYVFWKRCMASKLTARKGSNCV